MHRGKQIRGSWGGGSIPDRDIPKLAALYHERKLPLQKIISHRYPFEAINQAMQDLADRKTNRALIEIQPQLAPSL
jgi:S-(hydroxymethyl)glutathione dehydrogenase/alcohol dehydrogenase